MILVKMNEHFTFSTEDIHKSIYFSNHECPTLLTEIYVLITVQEQVQSNKAVLRKCSFFSKISINLVLIKPLKIYKRTKVALGTAP